MSTATENGWTVAVFAEDDLFGVTDLHLPQQVEEDRGYDGQVTCPCGYSGPTRWWPCHECGQSQCPKCGECACARRDSELVPCQSCFISVRPRLLEDGLSGFAAPAPTCGFVVSEGGLERRSLGCQPVPLRPHPCRSEGVFSWASSQPVPVRTSVCHHV